MTSFFKALVAGIKLVPNQAAMKTVAVALAINAGMKAADVFTGLFNNEEASPHFSVVSGGKVETYFVVRRGAHLVFIRQTSYPGIICGSITGMFVVGEKAEGERVNAYHYNGHI